MAAQADGLFIDRGTVGVDCSLGQDALRVDRGIGQDLLHPLFELLTVFDDALGRARFDGGDQRQDGLPPGTHISRHFFALPGAHDFKLVDSLMEDRQNVARQLLCVFLDPFAGQHVRHFGERQQRDVVGKTGRLAQLTQRIQIALCQREIDANAGIVCIDRFHLDENIDLTTRDPCTGGFFQRFLEKAVGSRTFDIDVQIAMIDRADFNGDLTSADGSACAAVAGHTFHIATPLLLFIDCETAVPVRASLRRFLTRTGRNIQK